MSKIGNERLLQLADHLERFRNFLRYSVNWSYLLKPLYYVFAAVLIGLSITAVIRLYEIRYPQYRSEGSK